MRNWLNRKLLLWACARDERAALHRCDHLTLLAETCVRRRVMTRVEVIEVFRSGGSKPLRLMPGFAEYALALPAESYHDVANTLYSAVKA